MPTFRGVSNSTAFSRQTRGFISCLQNVQFPWSVDQLGDMNCQFPVYSNVYGTTFDGFSVDNMADDTLRIISSIKQDKPLYVFARGFGTYVLNRMMIQNSTLIDAIIMDSPWQPNMTVTDWDVNRSQMGPTIMNGIRNATQSRTYQDFSRVSLDVNSMFANTRESVVHQRPLCGQSFVTFEYPQFFKDCAGYALFEPSFRARFLQSILQLNRCQPLDFGYGIHFSLQLTNDPSIPSGLFLQLLRFMAPVDPTFIANHVILSELIDFTKMNNDDDLLYTTSISRYADKIRKLGWKTYTKSSVWGTVGTFDKPMLMLNGEFNPHSTIAQAKLYASNFNKPNQQLVIMPGMNSESVLKSYMRNTAQNTTCGMLLLSQFVKCPNCTLDTSCVSSMVGLAFDGDAQTTAMFADPFATYYIQPTAPFMAACIVFSLLAPLPIIFFILLIVFRKQRRVKSRLFAPHVGLCYVLCHIINLCVHFGGQFLSLPLLDLAVLFQDVFFIVSSLVLVLQVIRFFSLTAIYRHMANSTPNNRFIKFLASKILFGTLVTIVGVTWVIFGIICVVLHYYTTQTAIFAYIMATIVASAILAAIAIVFFVYDIVNHAVLTKCDIKDYFIRGDPLLYRVDSALIPPILAFGVIGNVVGSTASNIAQLPEQIVVFIIFVSIYLVLMCFFFGGNIVIACLIDWIRMGRISKIIDMKQELNEEDELKLLFSDEVCNARFTKYCSNEFSLENVIAWKEIEDIRAKYDKCSPMENREKIQAFIDKFLVRGGDMELNLVSNLVKRFNALTSLTNDPDISENDTAKKTITDMCDAIMGNLIDTFSRFRVSQDYEECKAALAISKKLTNNAPRAFISSAI